MYILYILTETLSPRFMVLGSTFPTIKCRLFTSMKLPSKFISDPNVEHLILNAPRSVGVSNRTNTVSVLLRFKLVFYKNNINNIQF